MIISAMIFQAVLRLTRADISGCDGSVKIESELAEVGVEQNVMTVEDNIEMDKIEIDEASGD